MRYRFDEANRVILESVVSLIDEARVDNLSDLRSVTIGERSDSQLVKPCAWVWIGDEDLIGSPGSTEEWRLYLDIMVIVSSSDVVEGYLKPNELAKRIRRVLLQSNRLNLPSLVHNVKSLKVFGTRPFKATGKDYTGMVRLTIDIETYDN